MLLAASIGLSLAACRAEPASNLSQPVRAQSAQAGLERVPLEIRSGVRVHRFIVEVARSPDEQARGMMFREEIGPQQGMIFPLSPPRVASFWMRNTLIPLDMLFVRQDGTIARIAANTVPHSEIPVTSGEPVAAVLELGGGRAEALGIEEGDRVSWPG